MCIKRKIISSLGVSVLVFNVSLSTPIFANEYETNLERLQKKVNGSWETVQAWTETSSTTSCRLNKTISVSKGNSYRIFSTVKAYKGTDSESIAVYSNIVNY